VQAQEFYPEFAPIGAEWFYTYTSADPLKSCEHYKSLKDTVIDNKICKMVISNSTSDTTIFFQDEKKIYYYQNDEFHLIYDFGVNIGDTICFSFKRIDFNTDSITSYKIKCKVESISLNEQNLKQFSTTLLDVIIGSSDWLYSGNNQYNYMEKIGHSKVFMETISNHIDAATYTRYLRCYHDNDLDFVSDWWSQYNLPCNSSGSGIKNSSDFSDITIFPNPAIDKFTITSYEFPVQCLLINSIGKIITSFTMAELSKEIDISTLPAGVYFLRLQTRQYSTIKPIVKLLK
jgi:hypothetical protein